MTASTSPAFTSCPSVKLMATIGPVTIGLMVTVLEAWTVPRPLSTTGTSSALTGATVTGVGPSAAPALPLCDGVD